MTRSVGGPARRVLVIGNGGAGKSTLAAALGVRTGLPVTHLDAHHWRAGWTPPPADEWHETLARLVGAERWILDGNYRGTLKRRAARADALILLDPPTRVCLWRIVRRRFGGRATPDLAEGCAERLEPRFVRYVASYRRTHLPDALAACEAARAQAKTVLRIRGRVDVERVAVALGYSPRT